MKDIEGRLSSYKDAPWSHKNMIFEDENLVVYKDGYPVTEGHVLFVPKKVTQQLDIIRCFELAYKWGVKGVCEYKWVAFNVGINNGVEAGQSVMWPHVHLIPRRKGDTPNPRGGVRHVIPLKGDYDDAIFSCDDWEKKETRVVMGVCFGERDDTTEADWENEGGGNVVSLPNVDDNTPREELDNWKERYKGYREWKKKIPMTTLHDFELSYYDL
jgi:diadenosine tetraphosphate (Ap4A) HIT family hydrolase